MKLKEGCKWERITILERCLCCEVTKFSASSGIFRVTWNPVVYFHVHNNPPLVPFLLFQSTLLSHRASVYIGRRRGHLILQAKCCLNFSDTVLMWIDCNVKTVDLVHWHIVCLSGFACARCLSTTTKLSYNKVFLLINIRVCSDFCATLYTRDTNSS
jgi:hypothetical protein